MTRLIRPFRFLLVLALFFGTLTAAKASVFVSVGIAPPPIPVYVQPEIPGDGYIWTPGYWAWDGGQYYWVEGAWVLPPYQEALWTPGWWGYGGSGYFWNAGYWGREVGYYGGINYGFGYFGTGFYGGYWGGGRFFYNRAYFNYRPGFRGNIYNRPYNGYNGRPGGPAFNSHPPIQYIGHNGGHDGFNHGSPVNGHSFEARNEHGFENHNGQQGFGNRGNENRAGENRGFDNRNGQQGFGNRGSETPHAPQQGAVMPHDRGTDRLTDRNNDRGFGREQGASSHNEIIRAPQQVATPPARQDYGSRYGSPATAQRSYEAPQQQRGFEGGQQRSYSPPAQQQRTFSAPVQQSVPHSYSAPSGGGNAGGGFHGNAGSNGGGGFHGGGRH